MSLVDLEALGKRYPGATGWALRSVTLSLEQGDVLGLIGENGAGKTTLIRLLLGFIRPSAGRVLRQPGRRMSYVPDRPAIWPTLSVTEHLSAVGRCGGLRGAKLRAAVSQALEMTDLVSKAGARTASLSRGMLQRLGVGTACLTGPDLVVLDEPASGLDPAGQRSIRDLIQAMHSEGRTILLSSHYLVELEKVCTRIGVLHQGNLVLDRPLAELVLEHRQQVDFELSGEDRAWAGLGEELRAADLACELQGTRLVCRGLDDVRYFRLMDMLSRRSLRVLSLAHPGLLEQVFVDATGGGRR